MDCTSREGLAALNDYLIKVCFFALNVGQSKQLLNDELRTTSHAKGWLDCRRSFRAWSCGLLSLAAHHGLPKRVSWDQTKLKAIAERIVAAGEPLSEYIDVEFSVSEKRFSAWPTNMKEQFVEARTVKGGKPAIKVEFNGVEVQ